MSGFKRDSSRFSKGSGGNSGSREESGSNRGTSRSNNNNGGGRNENRSYSRGGSSNGGGKSEGDFPFTRIGSLTIPKSAPDDIAREIENLRGSDMKLTCKIYLGKGDDNEVTLRTGDLLTISFKVSDKDKEFVMGHVAVKN